jgi:hypothetical protein
VQNKLQDSLLTLIPSLFAEHAQVRALVESTNALGAEEETDMVLGAEKL